MLRNSPETAFGFHGHSCPLEASRSPDQQSEPWALGLGRGLGEARELVGPGPSPVGAHQGRGNLWPQAFSSHSRTTALQSSGSIFPTFSHSDATLERIMIYGSAAQSQSEVSLRIIERDASVSLRLTNIPKLQAAEGRGWFAEGKS